MHENKIALDSVFVSYDMRTAPFATTLSERDIGADISFHPCAISNLLIASGNNENLPVNMFATYLLANGYTGEKIHGHASFVGWAYDENMQFVIRAVPDNALPCLKMLHENYVRTHNADGTPAL